MTASPAGKRKPPPVVVIAGPNGAGKSTAALEMYLPLADRWTVLDNASGTLKPIAHGTARRTHVEDPEKWLNLKQLAQ